MIIPNSKKNLIVSQANELAEARYKLTVGEQKLIYLMIAFIEPEDDDLKEYELDIKTLASFLGMDLKYAYTEINKIIDRLLGRVLFVPTKQGAIKCHWISEAEYKDGRIFINFSHKLKPYLLNLKKHFSSSDYYIMTQFNSNYTIRIYLLLKHNEYKNEKYFDYFYKDLRETLGINKEEYKLYKRFRQFVLDQAKKELSEKAKNGAYKSDLSFRLEVIERKNRKIYKLRFHIIKQQHQESLHIENEVIKEEITTNIDEEKKVIYEKLIKYGIKEKQVLSLCEFHPIERLNNNIRYVESEIKKGREKANIAGFLVSAITGDYYNQTELQLGDKKEVKRQDKKREEAKQLQQTRINSKKSDLGKKFAREKRKMFLDSLSNDEKEKILSDIKINNTLATRGVNDIFSPKVATYINALIPNFEKEKQKYIKDNM